MRGAEPRQFGNGDRTDGGSRGEPAAAGAPLWLLGCVFTPLYMLAVLAGYAFYLTRDSGSAFWPASGLALAALAVTRYRAWPLIVVLIGVVEIGTARVLADSEVTAFASISDLIEPMLGAFLVRRFIGARLDLSRVRDAVGLVVLAGVFAPALSALVGAYSFVGLRPEVPFVSAWQVWWFGDGLGVMVVAPVLLAWVDKPRLELPDTNRGIELFVLLALVVIVGIWVLGAPPKPYRSILDFPFVTFPLLIWATLRFDIRIVGLTSALVAFFTVWNASMGKGPFMLVIAETVQANILAIQAFITTVVLSALFLSAALADRRREERVRELLERQVAEAQKLELVARLAGSVAHDFNNDLTVVMSWTDLIKRRTSQDAELKRAVSQISRAAQRAASMTSQLLSFGRTPPGPKQTLSIADLADGWRTLLQPLFHGTRSLDVDVSPDAGFVRADPHQLDQLLLNLAINARDAMPGGGRLRIRASACSVASLEKEPQSMTKITVQDDGEGMSEVVLERIFDPFFTTKTNGRGTGLGLPSVRRSVAELGGRIEVASAPGQGTTFEIYLPRVQKPEPRREPTREVAPSGSETILVVDDDDEVREAVSITLESGGYNVLPAASGAEAMQVVASHSDMLDLVITDLNMPEGSGEELIQDLAAERPSLPVLVVSGYSSSDNPDLPPEVVFVPKPFSSKTLLSCVRDALRLHREAPSSSSSSRSRSRSSDMS